MSNLTLFAHVISKVYRSIFNKSVSIHQSDKHQKGFNSWTQLVSMRFCHFANSKSVRDISNGMRLATGDLNHSGIHRVPSKSSISYQNKAYQLFREYYYSLLGHLRQQVGFMNESNSQQETFACNMDKCCCKYRLNKE